MQYSQNHSNSPHKNPIPPGSPWRGHSLSSDKPQKGLGGNSEFAQGAGLKLPSLPKLGTQNQSSKSINQKPNQPSFAQMVQAQQQPHTPSGNSLNGKPSDYRMKLSGGHGNSRSSTPASSANREASRETGAQILGSVNAQMMPKVNTSYGMSSLNTVLPGMNPDSEKLNKTSTSSTIGASPGKPSSNDNLQNSMLMRNLSIQERSGTTLESPAPKQQEGEKYGLKSLLDVMESKSKEKQSVILGSDMSQHGLDLNSAGERLSHSFASPWLETSKHPVIPDYKLPACYSIDTIVPQQQKLQNFDEGALFYIFYTMPRDAMQEAAAVELTNRSWRYHKELKMWLTKDPLSEPIQTNNQEESGIYIFFDPTSWKKIKREYILYYPDIA